jgi:uncharacterized protein involved in exopolysaccharide biosynthesis
MNDTSLVADDVQHALKDLEVTAPLPPQNGASVHMTSFVGSTLEDLRNEKAKCEDQVQYWSARLADVNLTMKALKAAQDVLNKGPKEETDNVRA